MSTKIFPLASIALSCVLSATIHGDDAFALDSEGYVRNWVMLAPIPLAEEEPGSEAIYKQQIRGEGNLRPKAGDTVKVGNKELTWQNIAAPTNYLDLNAVLKTVNDRAAGYMVTYIECEN